MFTNYYANPVNPNSAKENLEQIIKENHLPVIIKTNEQGKIELDLGSLPNDSAKNRVLNQLVRIENQKLQEKLKEIVGGDIDENMTKLMNDTQRAYKDAYGDEFSQELAQAMAEDNKTFIQAGTGTVSSVGMGLTVVGGILCFTPLAPVGAAMVTIGNTIAIGGMVSGTVVGGIEAGTRKGYSRRNHTSVPFRICIREKNRSCRKSNSKRS